MNYKDRINKEMLPHHIAVIMDGNGRWAKKLGKPRIFGHRNGVKSVRQTTEAAAEMGIDYLTLYAFSTENWGRPKPEVNALMRLLVQTMKSEIKTLMDNEIRLMAIGDIDQLPSQTLKSLREGIETTAGNTRMTLTLALNYSSRWDITRAMKQIAGKVASGELAEAEIDQETISRHLSTHYMPDPELLVRTSGEYRISNYLLWEISYAELYFTDVHWPDFDKEQLYKAIYEFQNRERRFGKTGEQMLKEVKV
ncbi:MAG: isoprenyl transferase [Saprospiraceae bacterium]|nr:isoprenyl transferase [Saprospiraceae bacterium]